MKLSDNTSWLNSKNCKDGDIVEFINEGEWRDSTKFTYDDGNPVRQLVFKVKHNGEEKQISLIKPSRLAMIEVFGDDTVEWVGKKAVINLALNTQGGKSIMLKPVMVNKSTGKPVVEPSEAIDESEQETPF